MTFERATKTCHVSGSIYRASVTPHIYYAKNHSIPLKDRVPKEEQAYADWEEYDPDEEYGHY